MHRFSLHRKCMYKYAGWKAFKMANSGRNAKGKTRACSIWNCRCDWREIRFRIRWYVQWNNLQSLLAVPLSHSHKIDTIFYRRFCTRTHFGFLKLKSGRWLRRFWIGYGCLFVCCLFCFFFQQRFRNSITRCQTAVCRSLMCGRKTQKHKIN